ncbi:hypothetical protein FACS1894201_01330 [Bacteroidia bacterium]|nr:hypothetical protein FACS1894201_01330 [Bacteroidia bacterium]
MGLHALGINAFYNCGWLTSVAIPSNIASIGSYAFRECSGLTSVPIPSSVTSIEAGTFYQCSGLMHITIPSSVTSIGNNAFSYCRRLTSITIPSSITNIGNNAFGGCPVLISVTCLATTPPSLGNDNFNRISSDTLYVPADALNTYNANSNWNSVFGTIRALPNAATVKEAQLVRKLFVYPNPVVNGELRVENGELKAGDKIEIYNVNGVLVGARRALPLQTTIDISHLPAGEYILKIGNRTAKVVKR